MPPPPMLPGMNPGGWLLDVVYPDGRAEVELLSLGVDAEALAARHAGSGAFVTVYDGDTGEPTVVIGVV
jgi:hypothetical protein